MNRTLNKRRPGLQGPRVAPTVRHTLRRWDNRVASLSWQQRAVKALDGAVDARPVPADRPRQRGTWAWWEIAAPTVIGILAVARLAWAIAQ